MDMIWLQRDLGLYVVGLFDTFHAADCLGYPVKSLAALLKRFVDFDADKKNQRADWRIRFGLRLPINEPEADLDSGPFQKKCLIMPVLIPIFSCISTITCGMS